VDHGEIGQRDGTRRARLGCCSLHKNQNKVGLTQRELEQPLGGLGEGQVRATWRCISLRMQKALHGT
jgi:hypothetical protein